MLKASIPMKTWAEWNDSEPGFVQIDLVGHEGGDNNGQFFYTLDATDVATGWTEAITVRSKGERIVAAGLETLRLRFPFHIAGIHSDNGSEFINHHLARWCQTRQITFSRGRASNKNDQAHVEQKNWSVVRRSAGYFRYDTPSELDLLNQLWPLTSTQVNLFLPQQTLIAKTRTGAIVRKTPRHRHHPTAQTPRPHPDLVDPHDREHLQDQLRQDTDLHRPTSPDRRHPRQPHRTGPPPRHRPTPRKDQRRLPQPPQDDPDHAGTTQMSQRPQSSGHLDMSQQDAIRDGSANGRDGSGRPSLRWPPCLLIPESLPGSVPSPSPRPWPSTRRPRH